LLETEIGVRLLDRGRGGLRLTRAGEVLLEHADHLASRLQLADAQITSLVKQHHEEIRLGAFPTALPSLVPSAIAQLRSTRSELKVQLSEVTAADLESRLVKSDFDVALGYQDATTKRREIQGAERTDLFQETFLIGLPPDHPLARSTRPIPLAKLAEDDWIVPSTEGFLIQACRDAGFDPRVAAVTSDPLATRGLITRGLGVGWVPSLLIHEYIGVVIRAVKDPIRQRDIYALLPPGDRHPLAKPLIDALVQTASQTQPARATAN
jgi:DNA-binding transcriptional LysR family regulator